MTALQSPAPSTEPPPTAPALDPAIREAYDRALRHVLEVQQPRGAVAGEAVWNSMLVSQFVIARHVMGRPIDDGRKARIRTSLHRQRNADGGFGMHPDSTSYLFHTTLAYVALRLLGESPDEPVVADARRWIHAHAGVYQLPTWGRVWLAMLGLYPWSGVQPIVPELWLLPSASPLHPGRLYCHLRLIYLGLSYLYGTRFVAPADGVVVEIRSELYPEGYDERRFARFRDEIAPTDLFEAPGPALKAAFSVLRRLEPVLPSAVRTRALARAMEHIVFEFRSTGHVCLSPVAALVLALSLHAADPADPDLDRALEGLEYWVWEDDDEGFRISGARSDNWDTGFLLAAVCEGPPTDEARRFVQRAAPWLSSTQIQEEICDGDRHFRTSAYGGWGFADERHPWPVSDCTAVALSSLMQVESSPMASEAEGARLQIGRKLAAIEFILARQNDDGGFGSYEPRRAPSALTHLNPSEMYGNCVVEHSYSECTGSCAHALGLAYRSLGDALPAEMRARVREAMADAQRFLLDAQDQGGGWAGFWGIGFTYGTLFAVAGLRGAGAGRNHPAIVRGCRWLVDHQREDGGWGEHFHSARDGEAKALAPGEPSSVVQTAWALLTLLDAAAHEREVIDRGIEYLRSRQRPDGTWPPEHPTGVFFNTAVLDYRMYRTIFPLWALARYQRVNAT